MCAQGDREKKERWLEEAKAAYERYFAPKSRSDAPETWMELEEAAVTEGTQLICRLMGDKLTEKFAREDPAEAPCPWCGRQHCKRKTEGPEERTIQTRAGPVTFLRHGYFCPSCRKVFFPSGP